jgi:hypothetical protein
VSNHDNVHAQRRNPIHRIGVIGIAIALVGIAAAWGVLTIGSRRSDRCVAVFERDARYAAVNAFDRDAFRALHVKAEAHQERGSACSRALQAELEPALSTILRRAFHKAPDAEIIAYVQAKRAAVEALSPIDPERCVAALETGPEMEPAVKSPMWHKLHDAIRQASVQAQARLIANAGAPGVRSQPFSAEEAYAIGARYPRLREDSKAMNPTATPAERCLGDLQLYAAVLEAPEPDRARMLRFLLVNTRSTDTTAPTISSPATQ